MSLITVDPNLCNRDGLCIQACPANVLQSGVEHLPEVVVGAADRCIRCGHCVAVCHEGALTHAQLPAESFMLVPSRQPDAEEVENLLLSRRSVRGFKRQPVPREQLERLVETARRAPTASNTQNVSWVMILDPARLDRIRELTLEWLAGNAKGAHHVEAAKAGRDVVLRGGTVLAVAYGPTKYGWTDVDSAIALTYMEILASSMGLGACWGGLVTMAARSVAELSEVLGVPEGNRMAGALMLGQPRQHHFLIPPRNPAQVEWL
ncbi:nitroreductase family protein [Pseudodesulfovibrio sp.]|uniref:nitroreductase family protein n=1 Tax=unclassified Pseudodesulfovibrio TaxID=2661612 RepID=UPI003B00433F